MTPSNPKDILAEYDRRLADYQEFGRKLHTLLSDLVSQSVRGLHSLTVRVKDRESLARKLSKEDKAYTALSDVTDVVGLRIVTYLADDVNRVAEILESELRIDRKNTVDKRATLEADRFGYLSLHHVIGLKAERRRLAEWKRFGNLTAEVQTRSILQHAWAEIEHDLGYKSRLAIPAHIRRRFFRLAGLLELADQEFGGIREELQSYEAIVPERIASKPNDVALDAASLRSFVASSDLLKKLDEQIVDGVGAKFLDLGGPDDDSVENLLGVGVATIGELEDELKRESKTLVAFAKKWIGRGAKGGGFDRGVSLFYLWYVLIARTGDPVRVSAAIRSYNKAERGDVEQWTKNVLKIFAAIGKPS